jgi:hypothetical protein
VNPGGQGFTLGASGNGLAPATTSRIDVIPPPVTVANVSVQSVHTGKHKTSSVIVVQFADALSGAAADSTGAYSLTTVAKGKKAKGKLVPLAQSSYDPAAHTVRLTPRSKLVLNPPIQLRVNTASLADTLSPGVQAANDGQAGAVLVATLGKGGVSLLSTRAVAATATPVRQIPAGPVDALNSAGFRARSRMSPKASRQGSGVR